MTTIHTIKQKYDIYIAQLYEYTRITMKDDNMAQPINYFSSSKIQGPKKSVKNKSKLGNVFLGFGPFSFSLLLLILFI